MSLKARILAAQETALCFWRKWWRPLGQIGASASVWVNLVYLPIKTGKSPSLADAALYLGALGTLFAVRAVEKIKSVA